MTCYRDKSGELYEAIQLPQLEESVGNELIEWLDSNLDDYLSESYGSILIKTPFGNVAGEPGGWIVVSESGKVRTRTHDVFTSEYDLVSGINHENQIEKIQI